MSNKIGQVAMEHNGHAFMQDWISDCSAGKSAE